MPLPATFAPQTLGPHIVAVVERYITLHLSEPICLDDLARAAHMTRFYFAKLWPSRTGETPMQTVRRLRMTEACRLLREGTPMGVVPAHVGYVERWFERAFENAMGMTPMEYARQAKDHSLAVEHGK